MKDSLHFVNCFLPKAIINLLDKEEQLISKAVEAFCHKDPTDVKTMRRNLQFPVCFEDRSPLRGRYYKAHMTKCMYAQLDSQKCPLPASVSALISMNSQEIRLAHSMGMKITYGFEILYSRGPRMGPSKNNATFESAAFDAFLKYLEDRGYFKGELKGSKLHTKLLNSANSYFREFLRANLPRKPRDLEPSLSQVDVSQPCEKGHLRIEELSPGSSNSWLEISPQQLNALWEKRLGVKILDGTEKAPCVVANSVHSFVGGTSSHEGAEPTENIDEPNKQKIVDCLRSLLEFDNSYTNSNDELLTDEDILDENCSDDFSSSEIRQYYEAMDAELETTNLSKSFLKTGDILAGHSYEDEETDLNFNLVKNFFESYSSQQGDSGPVGNLLSSLGFLPPPDDPSSNLD
ncbi:protein ecdysoneless homolog [Zophobas morio]|uniref:protein ecdysoneless homolog n=1 Tax=Zophobas morio TaxID=2755281 RepID=UPI003083B9C2